MPELQAELGAALLVHEIADPPPGRDLIVGIDAGTARRNPSRLRNGGHLGKHQPRPAHRELAEVHQMKVARNAAGFRRIHVHRRHHDPVRDHHLSDSKRREHRGRRVIVRNIKALRAHLAGEPALHAVDKIRVAHAQIFVGHRLGARQHAEARLDRFHAPIARRVLGPDRADVRRVLRLLDVFAPRPLITLERVGDRRRRLEGAVELDRALHRELGA